MFRREFGSGSAKRVIQTYTNRRKANPNVYAIRASLIAFVKPVLVLLAVLTLAALAIDRFRPEGQSSHGFILRFVERRSPCSISVICFSGNDS
jgi:hypothetical protein